MDFDLDRFRAGDEALFADLVRRYSPRVLPHLRRYAGTEVDVNDLLQEVWLRAFDKRRTFDGRGSFHGWLLAVGRTVGVAELRRRTRRPLTVEMIDVAAPQGAEPRLDLDALREAVMSLPARQRDVVLLRLVEGRSTSETAHALGCAEGTVKAALHHATVKLRDLLRERVS